MQSNSPNVSPRPETLEFARSVAVACGARDGGHPRGHQRLAEALDAVDRSDRMREQELGRELAELAEQLREWTRRARGTHPASNRHVTRMSGLVEDMLDAAVAIAKPNLSAASPDPQAREAFRRAREAQAQAARTFDATRARLDRLG